MKVTIVDIEEKFDRELFYSTFADAIINSMEKKKKKEKEKKENEKEKCCTA